MIVSLVYVVLFLVGWIACGMIGQIIIAILDFKLYNANPIPIDQAIAWSMTGLISLIFGLFALTWETMAAVFKIVYKKLDNERTEG